MKKFGFTLAEVLITVGIIGVIATLTIPTVVTNVQKEQVGPRLAKAINTLENANKLLLNDNNARHLDSVCGDTDYLRCIAPYLNGANFLDANIIIDYNQAGNNVLFGHYPGNEILTTKDGISYIRLDGLDHRGIERFYYEIAIDINGVHNNPNYRNRDYFRFLVGVKGDVVAFGGRDYQNLYDSSVLRWERDCNSYRDRSSSCTGSIVDHGFKVVYDF